MGSVKGRIKRGMQGPDADFMFPMGKGWNGWISLYDPAMKVLGIEVGQTGTLTWTPDAPDVKWVHVNCASCQGTGKLYLQSGTDLTTRSEVECPACLGHGFTHQREA